MTTLAKARENAHLAARCLRGLLTSNGNEETEEERVPADVGAILLAEGLLELRRIRLALTNNKG